MNNDMSQRQQEERTKNLYVLAAEKLRRLGVIKRQVVNRKKLLSHMKQTTGMEIKVSHEEYIESFLATAEPVAPSMALPPTPPNLATRRPYKLSDAMQLSARKARAEQPELISVNSKIKFINLGRDL